MPGKQLEHVIEERQSGIDAGLTTTVEVKLQTHIGLFGFTLDLRDSRRGLRHTALRFVHCLHLVDCTPENDAAVASDSSFSLSLGLYTGRGWGDGLR